MQDLNWKMNGSGGDIPHFGLHKHQIESLLSLLNAFTQKKFASIVMPPAAGKSEVAVLATYVLNARSVLVIAPSSIVSNMLYRKYREFPISSKFFEGTLIESYYFQPSAGSMLVKNIQDLEKNIETRKPLSIVDVRTEKRGWRDVSFEDIPAGKFDLVIISAAQHYTPHLMEHFVESEVLILGASLPRTPSSIVIPEPCNKQMPQREYENLGVRYSLLVAFARKNNLHGSV